MSDADILATSEHTTTYSIINRYLTCVITDKALDDLKSGIDHMGSLAVLEKYILYILSYMAPWTRDDDVDTASDKSLFNESPYLDLHVRRGDQLASHEAKLTPVDNYLMASVECLSSDSSEFDVGDIKGMWVAPDDPPSVVFEVREMALNYFPDITSENIVYDSRDAVPTTERSWQPVAKN